MEKQLYRVPELVEILGLGKSTLWSLIADGSLPVVKIGRATRVHAEDVKGFAAQLRSDSTPGGAERVEHDGCTF